MTYSYNGFNQLVYAVTGEGAIAYTYNAQGIRTSRTIGQTTTHYLLDGGNVIGEVEGDEIYTYVRGVNLIFGRARYYLYNAHGDVVQLTNTNGELTKNYNYDAFGNERGLDEDDTNPFRYCGEYYDTETGLYYLRARYYDPLIGRFTQEDTHWNTASMIYGDNPQKINEREDKLGLKHYSYAPQLSAVVQSGNLYVYGLGNPVQYADYSGEIAFLIITGIIGAVVGAAVGAISSYVKTGDVSWDSVGIGALAGGLLGMGGGAVAAYFATGAATASLTTVLSAGANRATAMAASGSTTSAAIGRTFEKWFYTFNNIEKKAQQVVVPGFGRVDAFVNGTIYELKNYDWSKYSPSQIGATIANFTSQAQRYLQIGEIHGSAVRNVIFYFSSRPPQQVIDALRAIGVQVQWVPPVR